MKKILLLLLVISALTQVQACSNKAPDLKSPCVGEKGSPCGPKRAANQWLA